jgi:predicted aldo/keto reductase-like oxidoreductase
MQYRNFGQTGEKVSALGFGCMRFPVLENGEINVEESVRQLRHAIDRGVNYLDTAYVYHGGKSEGLVAKAIKDGYREKVFIADKNPVWLVKKYEDFEKYLDEQLARLETDYIDFYLLHALDIDRWNKIKELGAREFLDKALKDGKIKHAGFSFHDDTAAFKQIIDDYNWDFCQMQYNYMDEYNQAGTEGLEYAASKGLAIIIMEPLLGGKLAKTPPKVVQEIWDRAEVKRTPAEWALRWLWNRPEISLILSGMNSMEMVEENMKTAETALPGALTAEEIALVSEVRDQYKRLTRVNCTACRYCMPCPFGVDIPGNFATYNEAATYDNWDNCSKYYNGRKETEKASACAECGKCEKVCPQHLNIREHLKELHKELVRA